MNKVNLLTTIDVTLQQLKDDFEYILTEMVESEFKDFDDVDIKCIESFKYLIEHYSSPKEVEEYLDSLFSYQEYCDFRDNI